MFAVATVICTLSMSMFGCIKSDGDRTGKLIKFSKSGVLIKSHEGILQLGETRDSNWHFSIKDGNTDMIKFFKKHVGEEVSVKYNERVFEPISNFGYDTRYYVKTAKVID